MPLSDSAAEEISRDCLEFPSISNRALSLSGLEFLGPTGTGNAEQGGDSRDARDIQECVREAMCLLQ